MSLIVAMTMKCQQIVNSRFPPLREREEVIDFDLVFIANVAFTVPTASLLLLQEPRERTPKHGMRPQSLTPIEKLSIVGTRRAFHLDVSLNMAFTMFSEPMSFWGLESPSFPSIYRPVLVHLPEDTLAWVPAFSPTEHLLKEQMVTLGKDSSRHDRVIVPCPTQNQRVELPDQPLLGAGFGSTDDLPCFFQVPFDRFLTGSDPGFKAKWFAVGGFSRVGSAYRVLPDGESQEITSHVALIGMEGVGDPRFTWLKFQPDLS